jgi:hypothetical protein
MISRKKPPSAFGHGEATKETGSTIVRWPMRLIAFRISQHSASSHEEEEELLRCESEKSHLYG